MLYHTSPELITQAEPHGGLFGDWIFFSNHVYVMTAVKDYKIYAVDESEFNLINEVSLQYDDNYTDELDAMWDEAIERKRNADCGDEFALADWNLQKVKADIALAMGYDGLISEDEQGSCYMLRVQDVLEKWKLVDRQEAENMMNE